MFWTSKRRRKCPQINQQPTEQAPPPQPTKTRGGKKELNNKTKQRHPGAPISSRQVCARLFIFPASPPPPQTLRPPPPTPASAVSSDKSLPGCISPPLPSMSAPIGVFPSPPSSPLLLFHLLLFNPSIPPPFAGASPAGLFGRLSSAAAVSPTQPFLPFEMTQIFRLAPVFLTVSSPPARASVLLISGFLLSAPPPSAANLRAGFGGYFSFPSTISFVSPDHSQAGLACRRR